MAWRCSATTNEGLIQALHRESIIKTDVVRNVMLSIDRKNFLPNDPFLRQYAYEDRPLPIGYNVTISAPHMHAMMLELLLPYLHKKNGQPIQVLDVGSGSGYLTVALAKICDMVSANDPWRVVGIEHVPQLKQHGESVAKAHYADWVNSSKLQFHIGDGRSPQQVLGDSFTGECFDAIHVGAAAYELHDSLLALLKRGGAMVIPVGDQSDAQALLVCEKDANGVIHTRQDSLSRFVPLTSVEAQLGDA
ncbi:protein-L-isoaspartate(D-aspartate) O-methyltransferase [Angomonas deanei]|nr:protein-L-isoaspartate(D-aspartate) O-methyltransferase [Angomonas deanei]|eukprot:EPY24595.1 protein-L-isoaspartate(D-aspartate) O-methyltransferase [Angomonas deanei]